MLKKYPLLLLLLSFFGSAFAQTMYDDPTFSLAEYEIKKSFFNGDVTDHFLFDDNTMMVLGNFNEYNDVAVKRLIKLKADGTIDRDFDLDDNISTSSTIVKIAPFTYSRTLIVCRSLTTPYTYSIKLLNYYGKVDNSFAVPASFNDVINVVKLSPNKDKIYVAGNFTKFNTSNNQNNRLVRLNLDGSHDNTFVTNYIGASNAIHAVKVYADNSVIVAGSFDYFNFNTNTPSRVVKLNADGTKSATFNHNSSNIRSSSASTAYNQNPVIYAIETLSDGYIMLGGDFTAATGLSNPELSFGISKLFADGNVDPYFSPAFNGVTRENYKNGIIYSVSIDNADNITLAGIFDGYSATVSSVRSVKPTYSNVLSITKSGALRNVFNTQLRVAGAIRNIKPTAAGNFIITGDFTHVHGFSTRKIHEIKPDGSLTNLFLQNASLSTQATALKYDATGQKIFVGGAFNYFGNKFSRSLVKLDVNGVRDASFNVGSGFDNGPYEVRIQDINLQADGKVLVVGEFNSYNGTSINNIVRLNTNGTIDNQFNNALTGATSGNVYKTLELADGKILVGGSFFSYNNDHTKQYFIRVNANGTVDNTFNPSGQKVTGAITAVKNILQQPNDKKILIAGTFSQYGTITTNNLARLDENGSLDTEFATNLGAGFNNTVNKIVLLANGKILVVGDFTAFNNNTDIKYIARLNANGTLDETFNVAKKSFNASVTGVSVTSDGKIIVIGRFTNFDNQNVKLLVKLNEDGTLVQDFTISNFSNGASLAALALQNDDIIAIGQFWSYGGDNRSRNNILRLAATDRTVLPVHLLSFKANANATAVQLTWVTANEVNNKGFDVESSSNGKTWNKIGFVSAKDQQGKTNYNFVDANPFKGDNYYRLKQIDLNGKFEYSNVALANFKLQNNLLVYPNPVLSQVTFKTNNLNYVGKQLAIYNSVGKKVATVSIAAAQTIIDLSTLNAGIYFIKLPDGKTEKLVKK